MVTFIYCVRRRIREPGTRGSVFTLYVFSPLCFVRRQLTEGKILSREFLQILKTSGVLNSQITLPVRVCLRLT